MPIKKSELYSSLWKSCDELRGGMDASQYKDYVLVLLFVKYVSDKYSGQPDALIEVPDGGSFADMVALKGDKEIGDKINKIIGRLAEANELKGVIDVADFNDADKLGKGKEMVDRLSNLVAIFETPGLDFSRNRAEGDDILGDAYEYLMRHFATESGKSKGQFYTPAEVSRIMAKVIGIGSATSSIQTIYDPTCGSGSLLLKAHDEAPVDVSIYGQEMDNATAALAKMNMILHDCPTAEIWQDNTLSTPHFKEKEGGLSRAEIESNDFNLNIPRYIDATEAEDIQDIEAHLKGGIPNRDVEGLAPYWQVCPGLKVQLFAPADRSGYSRLTVESNSIKNTIFDNAQFIAFTSSVSNRFGQWKNSVTPALKGIAIGSHPKQLIEQISEELLEMFRGTVGANGIRPGVSHAEPGVCHTPLHDGVKLIDPYDVYQHLMSYWSEVMQDDVYLIASDGWLGSAELIPPPLIINRYFAADQQQIEKLETERDAISRRMEELEEEQSGEDGLLEEAKNDKGKLTKASVKARLTQIKQDKDAADERKQLTEYLELIEAESAAGKKVKDAQKALDAKVKARYADLTEAEVKMLVVDDKWLATLATDVQTELNRVSQALTSRIRQLAERYATPLPQLTVEVEALSARVDEHLKKMGFL